MNTRRAILVGLAASLALATSAQADTSVRFAPGERGTAYCDGTFGSPTLTHRGHVLRLADERQTESGRRLLFVRGRAVARVTVPSAPSTSPAGERHRVANLGRAAVRYSAPCS